MAGLRVGRVKIYNVDQVKTETARGIFLCFFWNTLMHHHLSLIHKSCQVLERSKFLGWWCTNLIHAIQAVGRVKNWHWHVQGTSMISISNISISTSAQFALNCPELRWNVLSCVELSWDALIRSFITDMATMYTGINAPNFWGGYPKKVGIGRHIELLSKLISREFLNLSYRSDSVQHRECHTGHILQSNLLIQARHAHCVFFVQPCLGLGQLSAYSTPTP